MNDTEEFDIAYERIALDLEMGAVVDALKATGLPLGAAIPGRLATKGEQ